MPRKNALALLLVLLAGAAHAQTVTMPQAVTVAPYRLAAVEMSYDGDDFAYSVAPELDAFREYTEDPKVVRLRVQFVPLPGGPQSGTFLITAVAAKSVDGKGKLSSFQSCLVNVQGPTPVPVPKPTPDPDTTPDPAPLPQTPTAAAYIYEHGKTTPPPPVLAAIDALNRNQEKKIVATIFAASTVDGTGQTPKQYQAALAAARTAGLPALVVTAGANREIVLRVVKDPRSEQEILDAVK